MIIYLLHGPLQNKHDCSLAEYIDNLICLHNMFLAYVRLYLHAYTMMCKFVIILYICAILE